MRVALYIRVSSQEQVEGYSIGEQTERLNKYAEAMEWTVYKTYVDPGYSGGNINRPGLNEMIRDIESGGIDAVIVYKLDRLSRSQFDTLYLIEKVFLANDTDFISMTESFSTKSSIGKAMIGFLAVFAQLEKDKINERTLMGKEARAKEGKWGGGSSEPIGYDYNPATEELTVNEYEKMQILEAVDLFLKGTPLRTIERLFLSKGYTYRGRSGKTNTWDPKRFKYVFSNKLYLGYIRYRGEWYKADHEPIMDEETFDKVQKLLTQRAEMFEKHKQRSAGQTTYLGGMIYCKQCGGKYAKTSWPQRNGSQTVLYTCYSRSNKVPRMVKDPNCKNKNWKMQELDDIVFGEIKKFAMDPERISRIKQEKKETKKEPNKIDIIEKKIKEIDDQISRFMDLYGIGRFTIDQVSSKVDPLNEMRNGLQRELDTLNAESGRLTEEEAIEIFSTFDEVFERGDFDEIRLFIESLIYYIEIDNDDVYIHWKFA